MISNYIGYNSLLLGFLISIYLTISSIFFLNKKSPNIKQNTFSFLFIQFLTVIISFISLVYSFIISDLSNETVDNNSHTTKPMFYKIDCSLYFFSK